MDLLVSFNGDRIGCLACVLYAAGPVRAGAHVYEPERMHLSLFSNTQPVLDWRSGATKAMATGPGGARVLAGLFESPPDPLALWPLREDTDAVPARHTGVHGS